MVEEGVIVNFLEKRSVFENFTSYPTGPYNLL